MQGEFDLKRKERENGSTDRPAKVIKEEQIESEEDYSGASIWLLNLDLIILITSMIPFSDLKSFRTICKTASRIFGEYGFKIWKNLYSSRLLESGYFRILEELKSKDPLDSILNLLRNEPIGKIAIAGSFPLQFVCKAEEPRFYSDIDIFLRYEDNHDIRRILDTYFSNAKMENQTLRNKQYKVINRLKYVTNGILKSGVHFQLIFVELKKDAQLENIKNYILHYFDLSFCKCWFDGYALHCSDILNAPEKKGKIDRVPDIEKIRRKYPEEILEFATEIYDRKMSVVKDRIRKYRSKGFFISNEFKIMK